jgi:3-hydroxymyristoyl/3-hydroxydecanoyl-(acyl carrier protein) dehydratase
MDRVTAVEPQPWKLEPGGWVQAQYDIPADAWYFAADASGVMPFCVLLEIALQPCGWLAAYAGSALRSENDLKFRNLGGQAELRSNLPPRSRTLTMRTRMTQVSEAADMIIEHFQFDVLADGRSVYGGTTYFGFFTHKALSQQVGLREAVYRPGEEELEALVDIPLEMNAPTTPGSVAPGTVFQPTGLAMPGKALCMIDGIEVCHPTGGPHGLGFIRGYKIVDPKEWFFEAHFYQDPVCPGSLGIESFLQLIKFAALERWPHLKATHRFEMATPHAHQWSYRGQVIPTNQKVTVEAVITAVTEGDAPCIVADGCLQVDGIYIYKMVGFGLRMVPL